MKSYFNIKLVVLVYPKSATIIIVYILNIQSGMSIIIEVKINY